MRYLHIYHPTCPLHVVVRHFVFTITVVLTNFPYVRAIRFDARKLDQSFYLDWGGVHPKVLLVDLRCRHKKVCAALPFMEAKATFWKL